MSTIQEAYWNALLADATYALAVKAVLDRLDPTLDFARYESMYLALQAFVGGGAFQSVAGTTLEACHA